MLEDIPRNNSDIASRRPKHHELQVLLKKQKTLVCQLDIVNKQIQDLTEMLIVRPTSAVGTPTHLKLIPKYFEVNNLDKQPSFRRLSMYTNEHIECPPKSKWYAFLCCMKESR